MVPAARRINGSSSTSAHFSPYNPNMTYRRTGTSHTRIRKLLRWQPQTHVQALLSGLIVPLPGLAGISIFGFTNDWQRPWPVMIAGFSAGAVISSAIGQSLMFHLRHRRHRESHAQS